MTELPIWAQCESDEDEAKRLAARLSGTGGGAHRFLAVLAMEDKKDELDDVPRWRLLKRWRIVREAKLIAKDAGII